MTRFVGIADVLIFNNTDSVRSATAFFDGKSRLSDVTPGKKKKEGKVLSAGSERREPFGTKRAQTAFLSLPNRCTERCRFGEALGGGFRRYPRLRAG